MAMKFSPGVVKQAISYYYLVYYCPAERINEFQENTASMRNQMAETSGMQTADFLKAVLPEVGYRISAFHFANREPDQGQVRALIDSATEADQSPQNTLVFQQEMSKLASLSPRAHPDNRLHRKKGCIFCHLPCHYGYFSLVSEPEFTHLRALLQTETQKPLAEQSPLRPAYEFTTQHLRGLTGAKDVTMQVEHLANLAYCLLMLGMAKSRLTLPEKHLQYFQAANQDVVQRIKAT